MTERNPRVLLVQRLIDARVDDELHADPSLTVIDGAGEGPDSLRRQLEGTDAIILRSPARLTADLIQGSTTLRVIGAMGAGYDNVDVAAATARGIPVISGVGIAPAAVAEYTLGAMVAAHRGFLFLHSELSRGALDWTERPRLYQGRELTGTTLGLVGYGQIGRLVATKARAAFDVDVIAFDPYARPDAETDVVKIVPELRTLLEQSDTVSVHVPRTRETTGLIGAEQLAWMRPDAVLIDTARGAIVDETALVHALTEGHLRGAVLDVFSTEPPPPSLVSDLMGAPRLLLTPHIAGATSRAAALLARNVVDQVKAVLNGQMAQQIVNPEVM